MTLLHLEHISVFSGRYAGKKIFNFESEVPELTNIFLTSIMLQLPQFLHFILSFAFKVIPQKRYVFSSSFHIISHFKI